ncbi:MULTISPECIES: hypothetical protein [unclassified Streptomyces]|uniref:hypothetical protein n=1 Tax=unclassified Streptomyces TaxID=2593676 RepID=UPI003D94C623
MVDAIEWEAHARHLATAVVRPESRWHEPLATPPRHLFVPTWWAQGTQGWERRDGPADPEAWMRVA